MDLSDRAQNERLQSLMNNAKFLTQRRGIKQRELARKLGVHTLQITRAFKGQGFTVLMDKILIELELSANERVRIFGLVVTGELLTDETDSGAFLFLVGQIDI